MHFDWSTLVLQTINVLVLLWLLRRFLFRPVVAIIAARKDAADKLLADAAVAREQAQATAAAAARREAALAADSDHIMADARAAAKTEEARLLEQATRDATAVRATALAGLERDRAQMRRDLEREAAALALTIASRLASRVPPHALTAALLQSLDAWLATLPAERLADLGAAGETLEIVTAAPLDAPGQAACVDMLNRRLGRVPTVRFGVDASLIAGVELRGAHATLRNNWRADLDLIAQELSHDDDERAMA
jgi:F-type H+-transporting ATPase subunit b